MKSMVGLEKDRPTKWWLLLAITSVVIKGSTSMQEEYVSQPSPAIPETQSLKLLILLIDGFRWDYYERHKKQLPGFHKLISEGVQAEYVKPIFPSLSYPSWTTLVTGLHPSSHNILGNYMLFRGNDTQPEAIFTLKDNSTKNPFWWQSAEPLWTTATKAGQKTYLANFAHCDVPFQGILPSECTGYTYKDFNFQLREHLHKSLTRFRQGYSLAMIYDDSIDHAGHAWGPNSNELKLALIRVDTLLQEYIVNMQAQGLYSQVNLVIISDHGMTDIRKSAGVTYVQLKDYADIESIYKVVDYGAVSSIAAFEGKTDRLYNQLVNMPGVDVYKQQDIPEGFHYKESQFVNDILLVAKPGYFIVGLEGDKQIPNNRKASSTQPFAGGHGYSNISDMLTVFFANGPAFKKGIVHPPINLVDEYQIFAKALDIQPQPHNGTWENVRDMFAT